MSLRIQATLSNTTIGDYVVQVYKNNNGDLQGPFYYQIIGMNSNSWKVKSVDAFGQDKSQNIIYQIKRNDGTKHYIGITSIHFGSRKNKPNYISWKFIPFPK